MEDHWVMRWRSQFETFSPREVSLESAPLRRENGIKWDFSSNFLPPSKEMIDVTILLGYTDKRFGFSVVGGKGERLKPRIDEIQPGSPADKADLEVGDEILEVNGKSLEDATHTEVISHIHQCIRSRTICLRVKRRSGNRLALDLSQSSNVQDAFVIAVEQQARERLEHLSALKRIKPVDMTKLSHQLNQEATSTEHQQELNGFIESSPIYVTSLCAEVGPSTNRSVQLPPSQQEPQPAQIPPSSQASSPPPSTSLLSNSVSVPAPITGGPCNGVSATSEVVELKQDLRGEPPAALRNGRTEKLIGQQTFQQPGADNHENNNNTTVNNNKSTPLEISKNTTPVDSLQTRLRRGGGLDATKGGSGTLVDSDDVSCMMMLALDQTTTGPHREMAVDVPDSFVARTKTPPRYPPPRRPPSAGYPSVQSQNGSPPGLTKPVPPPRAPMPPPISSLQRSAPSSPPADEEPTTEQLDSIRKFQEALRRRKEEEERVAQQTEFLNRSLRGSRKLQALESSATGVVNDGYSSTEDEEPPSEVAPPPPDAQQPLHKLVGYGELVASLQRLQGQLRRHSGPENLEAQVAAVQTLLLSAPFGRALAVHNKVLEVVRKRSQPRPVCDNAQHLVRDCLEAVQPSTLAEAAELTDLLTRFELEGLISAHDGVAAHAALAATPAVTPTSGASTPPPSMTIVNSRPPAAVYSREDNIKIIKIEKTTEPLGATVRNEGNGAEAVIIGRIVKGGAAEKSGLLREGDELLEVNGIEMRGKGINEVCDILSNMTGTLTFLVVPHHPPGPEARPTPTNRDSVVYMKAHFDYDPEDDPYIPCRELGISFQKGDILHVISQEDANWWQAYREGEEDQQLAGLIPSRSFQYTRESKKQTIAADTGSTGKSRKSSALLCAKKNAKKKKKKGLGPTGYSDGAYPLYATSNLDDYESEEILTYEDISLYYPHANHKRPVVLIGPPNIGRHELRQRLMEDADRFAAAVPHTSRTRKDGEADGQDYHFISRAQFEADILARRFVEHGEYEKAYYGTSLDAIRAVVNKGKICVLNLHPQSLKILRNSDLKPYVVFVAPPSLEKLRQKKIRSGEAYKEEELKDIIEKAREMEDRYGHYFDMIIINNDTERAYQQLMNEINNLEREPQWVPSIWLKPT